MEHYHAVIKGLGSNSAAFVVSMPQGATFGGILSKIEAQLHRDDVGLKGSFLRIRREAAHVLGKSVKNIDVRFQDAQLRFTMVRIGGDPCPTFD